MRNCQAIRILAWLFIARNLIKSYEKARFLEKSPGFWKAFAFLLTVTYTKVVRKRTAQVSGHKERFMRKKIFVTVLAMSLIVAAGSSTVFAQTTTEASLKTAEQLKEAIEEKMEDGVFSKTDQEMVLRSATDSAVSGLLVEKMDAAVELLETEVQDEMYALPDGSAYASHSYDLGDHCKLVVELQDRAENECFAVGASGALSPMANSGSTSEWKA